MTDMDSGEIQNQVSTQPVPASDVATNATNDEKVFRQSDVNDIVGHAKREAVERYRRSQEAERSRSEFQHPDPNQGRATQQVRPRDDDEIRRMAAEEAQRLMEQSRQDAYRSAQERDAQRIASEFFTKWDAGKSKYDDFEKVTSDLDLQAIPNIVELANNVENTADVMYELAKNPTKIGQIQSLINQGLGKLAYRELKRMADSIKQNEEATQFKSPNAPLSQLKPSNTGTGIGGALTVSEYRKKFVV